MDTFSADRFQSGSKSDMSIRLPNFVCMAMRVWALLDEAKRQKGWTVPAMSVSTDQTQ
jgi:hypothetical protein